MALVAVQVFQEMALALLHMAAVVVVITMYLQAMAAVVAVAVWPRVLVAAQFLNLVE